MAVGRRSFADLLRDADEQSRAADMDWRRDPAPAKYSVGVMGHLGAGGKAERAAQRAERPAPIPAAPFVRPEPPLPTLDDVPSAWGTW